MEEKLFTQLLDSVKEAGAIRKGKREPSRVFRFSSIDITRIREKLHCSQTEFAFMIGVSKRTLQNWEQGRRHPTGPARALLKIAAARPKVVAETLACH